MNKLSHKAIGGEEKIIPDSPNCPDFRIVIDDKETNHFFIIKELERSSEKSGVYTIITCSCGETGCSGAEVKVSHQNDEVLWEKMWHTDWDGKNDENKKREFNFTENKIGHPSLRVKLPFRFDKGEYKALALNLISQNKQ